MKKVLFATSILLIFSTCFSYQCWAADEESLGQQAEQAGKLREAVTHYVSALQSASEGGSKDQQLREKIITLAQKLTPPPAVPEEAQKYMGRGQGALEIARTPDDFLASISEFKKAARLAPWLASAYFNLAVVQEKAGQFNEAMRNFKFYLLAAPTAADAQEVKTRIYGLELKAERQQKEEREKAAVAELERQKQEVLDRFKRLVQGNTYENRMCNWFNIFKPGHEGEKAGCNEKEASGSNWYKFSGPNSTYAYYQFHFASDGKIALCGAPGELFGFKGDPFPCPSGFGPPELIGRVVGMYIGSIRISWRDKEGKLVWIRFDEDWSYFKTSFNRPVDDIGYDPSYRYDYEFYKKR